MSKSSDDRRLSVLMSAYACEPGKGSEPGVGWNWAVHMAQYHDVTVITRKNQKSAIDAGLVDYQKRPRFIYFDLPDIVLTLKRRGFISIKWYYVLWQIAVAARFPRKTERYDLIHHVTFNSFLMPGFWWFAKPPVLLGPLGGGMVTAKPYLRMFEPKAWQERLRTLMIKSSRLNPVTQLSLRLAAKVLCANLDTLMQLPPSARSRAEMMLETGITNCESEETRTEQKGPIHLVWVGGLIPRKGLELGLLALKKARSESVEVVMTIVGDGPMKLRLQKLGESLGLGDALRWAGAVPYDEVQKIMQTADALLFSSVRDTSGNVVLEAMAIGLPVIAIDHQGVHEILTEDCALLIKPGEFNETINQMAASIAELAMRPDRGRALGEHGRMRIMDVYMWGRKAEEMDRVYRKVCLEAIS